MDKQDTERINPNIVDKEASHLFWDLGYNPPVAGNFNAKAEAEKAFSDPKLFYEDVQTLTPNEFLATEKEVNILWQSRVEEWNQKNALYKFFNPPENNPLDVDRDKTGLLVEKIGFYSPAERHEVLNVTYWNSVSELSKIRNLSYNFNSADDPITRTFAEKALIDEVKKLETSQLARILSKLDTGG